MPGSGVSGMKTIMSLRTRLDRRAELTARSLHAARNFPHSLTHTAWHDWYPLTYF